MLSSILVKPLPSTPSCHPPTALQFALEGLDRLFQHSRCKLRSKFFNKVLYQSQQCNFSHSYQQLASVLNSFNAVSLVCNNKHVVYRNVSIFLYVVIRRPYRVAVLTSKPAPECRTTSSTTRRERQRPGHCNVNVSTSLIYFIYHTDSAVSHTTCLAGSTKTNTAKAI